jgi:AraC-like DNA-binding protein
MPISSLNLPSIFGIAAIGLALLLLVKVALSPASDRIGKYLLLLFITGLIGMAANSLYFLLNLHQLWPHASFLYMFLLAWIGPALWLYTCRVLGIDQFPFEWPSLWHWVPGVVLQLGLLSYLLLPAQGKLDFIYSSTGRWTFLTIYLSIYLQIAVYALMCDRILHKHKAMLAATTEKEELRTDLNWIRSVCYGFAGFVALDGIVPHLRITPPGASYAVAMALYLLIIVFVFHATSHGRVYPFASKAARSDPKYANSGLRDDSAQHYLGKLERLMQDEQPYLDSDLSLDKLASLLRLHPHYLSQILNDLVGKNFYDYINEHRIAYAKTLLTQQPDQPVVDVAIACGYNNKNSFYNSFKRFVGMTPTEFRQQATKTAANKSLPG